MPMTLSNLRDEVLNALDESDASSTDTIYTTVTNAIKQAHVIRLTETKWPFMLWDKQETITLVANQRSYPLHSEFQRPHYIRNRTRKVWLSEMPNRNLEPSGIDFTSDQDLDRFTLWGMSPVAAQPSSASGISIISSSISDTTAAKAIIVRGDTADGITTESLTPNGTSIVNGSVSFTKILEVIKSAAWVGTMTMTSNSAAVTNLKLFAAEYARAYPLLNLLYLPTAGETLEYQFYRQPNSLAYDNGVTNIPPPFERVLVFDALLLLAAYDNRLEAGRAGLWKEMRDTLDIGLRSAWLEGSSLGAEPRYIRDSAGAAIRIHDAN